MGISWVLLQLGLLCKLFFWLIYLSPGIFIHYITCRHTWKRVQYIHVRMCNNKSIRGRHFVHHNFIYKYCHKLAKKKKAPTADDVVDKITYSKFIGCTLKNGESKSTICVRSSDFETLKCLFMTDSTWSDAKLKWGPLLLIHLI